MPQFELHIDPDGVQQMRAIMAENVSHIANAIARDARTEAPVISGKLRDSIGTKDGKRALVQLVVADAPHAGLVHNGTSVGPKHPFSTKANRFVHRAAKKNFENLKASSDGV